MSFKRTVRRACAIVSVLAAAVAVSGCDVVVGTMQAKGKAQETWSRNYTVAPGGRVEVVNTNGEIVVTAGEGSQVGVRAERIMRGATDAAAREALGHLEIQENSSSSGVRLETKVPPGVGGRGEVNYYLTVPAFVEIDVQNTNGQVQLNGVKGRVKAETTNGGVRGTSLSGQVEASTTNGGITLDMDAVTAGGIRAETVNGGVQLTVPDTAKADVRASCVHGGVQVRDLKIDGEPQRRRIDGRLNGGGPAITLDTTNGGIVIRGKRIG